MCIMWLLLGDLLNVRMWLIWWVMKVNMFWLILWGLIDFVVCVLCKVSVILVIEVSVCIGLWWVIMKCVLG